MNTPKDKQSKENECLDTWICSVELEASAWQPSNLEEYEQPSLWKSIPTLNSSCDQLRWCAERNRISQEFQSIQTSETISPEKESLTLSQWDFPALAHQTQEVERDYLTQLHLFDEKDLVVLKQFKKQKKDKIITV